MDRLRKRWMTVILVITLVGAVGLSMQQRSRIVQLETRLGTYWSNELAMGFFLSLPVLEAVLSAWAAAGEAPAEEVEQWWLRTHNMLATVNNHWHDMSGLVPNLPDLPRHLEGYLERVRTSIPRQGGATGMVAFSEEQRSEFRKHAGVAKQMVEAWDAQYPGWGASPSRIDYHLRGFWRSAGWKVAITEMEAIARQAGYPPMLP